MRLPSKIRRDTFDVPVWLVCTSRGTLSIVNAATHLKTDRADGLFLTASVLTGSDRVLDVFQFGFTQIREPALKVHHHNDDFWVTPASKAEPFKQKLSMPSSTKVAAFAATPARHGTIKAFRDLRHGLQ